MSCSGHRTEIGHYIVIRVRQSENAIVYSTLIGSLLIQAIQRTDFDTKLNVESSGYSG